MKNLIRIPLALVALTLCCNTGCAQEFYRGEMFVTGQRFSLADGHLNIELSVDFEGLKMPSDESLTLTPVLISGENEQDLPAVLINGTEKQKVYRREQKFADSKHPAPIPAVVIRNDAKVSRSFHYRVAVPYQEWMKNALLLIRSQECACHGKQGNVYEDKIADKLSLPKARASAWDTGTDRKYLSWVNFIEPAPDKDTLRTITGSIPYFGRDSREKGEKPLGDLSEEKQDFEIYHRLRNALQDIRRESGTELSKVEITGYGAPIGNLKKNEMNAPVRALSLKGYLRENRLAASTPLEVRWISEDWDSIAALIKQSDMMFREAALDLINNVDIDKGRERMLMNLADGKPYKYLAERIFPEVMRVDYKIEYTRRPPDAAESLRLFRTGKRKALHLNEFFTVASSYPQGSREYNDVLDLAARLFPDSPEANINAAAVALTKGETAKARRYLERFATLPMAYNNMGILCLQEGNRDKAEVYLTMAAAAGIEQANEALKTLRRETEY
ncbi:DUF3868 domain-containing protein [Bacteroides clarus]|jgi:tetratricopeptide (TPR) repeat protein|uniref:DUF3868 domain-containing protein n=1 Tax=Bacteroides clarus TaxID=626929 RepID=A0A1Y3YNZ1_9BACE|nr:DUF3868 domain-containing protein [Bacteroides clarus]OUN99585.1 hypothetical protein B5F97_15640 [Bacteroides clarus]